MVTRRKHKATSTPQFTAEAHNKEGKRAAALREYEAYITNAWKNRSTEIDIVGVRPSDPDSPFLQAWLAWVNRADIVPLVNFINSDHPLSRLMRSAIAGLIGILYARSQPRKEGKPGGTHTRWKDPRYLVAWMTELHMNEWKQKEGRRNTPNAEQEKIIKRYIYEINGWAITREKKKLDPNVGYDDFERIKTLLNEPKNRRLPVTKVKEPPE